MLIALAVICTLCEAVFTAFEVAMSAVSRARLRAIVEAEAVQQTQLDQQAQRAQQAATGDAAASAMQSTADNGTAFAVASAVASRDSRRAASALRLLEQPERLTALFITVTSLSLWTAASALAWLSLSGDWPDWMLPLALLGVLFVAEVLPLLLAAHRAEAVAMGGAGLMQSGLRLLWPLLRVLGALGYGLARLIGAGPVLTTQVTEGELRTALATAEQEGVIESEERAMLEGAMSLRETPVREVMTPRGDMIAVAGDESLHQVLEVAMREGHSRLPVFDGTLDTIIGIVSTKDLIPHLRRPAAATAPAPNQAVLTARDVARPAFFVSDDKRIEPAVEDLRRQRSLMAVVRDASGATAGLVTLEDLLEEIVGEIQDEYDEAEPSLRVAAVDEDDETGDDETGDDEAAPRAVLCDAEVSVRDFERFWKRSFDETVRLHIPTDAHAGVSDSEGADNGNEATTQRDGDSANDEPPPSRSTNQVGASLSVAALAMRLFRHAPQVGDGVEAGHILSDFAANEDAAHPRPAAQEISGRPVIELKIVAMSGPQITQVRLQKAQRNQHEATNDA